MSIAPIGRSCVLIAFLTMPALAQQSSTPTPDVAADHAARMAKGLELFRKHVRPLLETKCLQCHGGKAVESELDLSAREGLLKGGQAGPAVVLGKGKESLLVKLISHERKPHMPHERPRLADEAIAQISQWIDLGAPYDNPLVASKAKGKAWTERVLAPEAKKFWSFEPLHRTALPAVKDLAWCRTPVDHYVRARQEAAGVTPNAPATRVHLIRRAYYDLLGLPPSPAEVQAFLDDPAPNAFATLVDKLLSSPHYGERWGRHWLDLARFAESHGFEHDYDRPSAYHYRDFVIEALNRDLPYDTFVKWQIAGDEYAPDDLLALKATGFLAAGVHSTQITKAEVEKHRYDEMDDKLNTLGTAMLGLSIGCARCHDHKFDPIPQRDYYQLLATFTTTVRSEIDLDLDPAADRRARDAFDREHAPFVKALEDYDSLELPKRLAAWESEGHLSELQWEVLEATQLESKGGATLSRQDDFSVTATGKNPKFDTYVITASTSLSNITAVRLEALSDPTLVKGGPGRAPNGNFALSDFQLAVAPVADKKPAVPIKFKSAAATFEQKGLPVKAAIDGDPKSAWAIDPQFGKDHAAVFEPNEPFGLPGGTQLTFTLKFNNNDGHNLGRIRLSLSTAWRAEPLKGPGNEALLAAGAPTKARQSLQVPAPMRTAEQTKTLLAWFKTIDPERQALNRKAQEHLAKAPKPSTTKCLVATEGLAAVRLHTQGDDFLPQTHFLRRGDPDNKEGIATQGFLQVLMPAVDAPGRWQVPPPAGARTSYRRRALAEWLTDTSAGAGNLLARVIVNRLWQHHLGRGLVATPSDFGSRGERPTHPELLDYLAGKLIEEGWRLKAIHKLIMTSAAYMQGSQTDEPRLKLDRDNKLCWHFPARRLEAEVIRDAVLAVSGELDPKMFGPGTLDPASKRRSIYFTVKRSKLVPMMVIFDAPEALSGMPERPTTTIAPQALHLLNSPQMREAARAFARRTAPSATTPLDDAVRAAYRLALTRSPSSEEATDAIAFIEQQQATYSDAHKREAALADFCQVLLCLNEFVYVE
jgi:hypothetical protein